LLLPKKNSALKPRIFKIFWNILSHQYCIKSAFDHPIWTLNYHLNLFSLLKETLKLQIPYDSYSLNLSHFAKCGTQYFLAKLYGSLPASFITSMEPEHEWHPCLFTVVPIRIWDNKSTHKLFFSYLETKLQIQNVEDWYSHLSHSLFPKKSGEELLFHSYANSPLLFLKSMIPHHKWQLWKFKYPPVLFSFPEPEHQLIYFEWLCYKLRLLIPLTFYSILKIGRASCRERV